MVWDIANTLLEFLSVYLLFTAFAHVKIFDRHLLIYVPIAVGLSIFFCLDIPHVLILNVGLFILCECVSFNSVHLKERVVYACFAAFITLSLEIFFNTFLPSEILHTFRGDTISNLLMVVLVAAYYFVSLKTSFHLDITSFMRRRYVLLIICFIIWAVLAQIYLQQIQGVWPYLPGLISVIFFIIFIIGIILDIRYIHSEEHKQNIVYKNNLASIEKYLQEIKIENHDYKHHIHYLQNRIRSYGDSQLQEEIDSYVAELDKSTELRDMILSINNSLFRSVLYGSYLRCQEYDIPFHFSTTNLLPAFPIKDYQLVSALENLISNAIESNIAVTDVSRRYLHISLSADTENNSVSVTNPIENYTGNIDDYFHSGYTTKDALSHQGLGLTSTLQALSDNGISLSAKYAENVSAITFTIRYSHSVEEK